MTKHEKTAIMDANKQRTFLKNNNSRASRLAVAFVFGASPCALFVFRRAQLTANTHSSNSGLNFQTRTDSLSDGQKVGPKPLVQHSHANKHWQGCACMLISHIVQIYWLRARHATRDINLRQSDTPAPRMFNVEKWKAELAL